MASGFIAKKHQPTRGDEFECRVARVLFMEGNFVRRKVDLEAAFGERFQITDVDVLVIESSDTLATRVALGECKATDAKNAPTVVDRLLWNTGLRQLTHADDGFVAVHRQASPKARRLAAQLDAEVVDPDDLDRREKVLALGESDGWGPHHPDLLAYQRAVRDTLKSEEQLRRIYLYLRSEFWFAPPVSGLKRALGAARGASRVWSPRLPAPERQSVEWLLREGVIAVAVALTRLAGDSYRSPEGDFNALTTERLAEGIADYGALQRLSKMADDYVMRVLTQAGVDPASRVESLGAFEPRVPAYTEPLLEVIHRFAQAPKAARDVTRLLDWRSAAAIRGPDAITEEDLFEHLEETARLVRLLKTFLIGQIELPEPSLDFMNGVPEAETTEAPGIERPSPGGDGDDEHPAHGDGAGTSQLEMPDAKEVAAESVADS